jgi:hypothetical protein
MYNPLTDLSLSSLYSLFIISGGNKLSLTAKNLTLAIPAAFVSATMAATTPPETMNQARLVESLGQLSLSFEANRGQTDPTVQFLSRGQGYSLFLTPAEAVLTLHKANPNIQPSRRDLLLNKLKPAKPAAPSAAVLRMQLQGANPQAQAEGLEELPSKTHYLRGKNPKAWRTGIPSYAKVKYHGIYPGIDLVYYGNQRQLEYDFMVAPGADPKAIHLRFDGAQQLSLDAKGQLIVKTQDGEVIQHRPLIYQEIGGVRKVIEGGYDLNSGKERKISEVGFQIARYDASKPLIIDPVLAYSTYWGGNGGERADDIAVDAFGNAYITGSTSSADFPIVKGVQSDLYSGSFDVFVTKFNTTGTKILYSTYLGGSESESGESIAVDKQGNAIISGYTHSADFPSHNPLQPDCHIVNDYEGDAFVAKLNATGTAFVYSTCLGGNSAEFLSAIAVDRFGNAYVTALTRSSDFPTLNPFQASMSGDQDPFISKISPTGSLVYSTYFGGSETFGEASTGVAIDKFGNAYIVGFTTASDFPTANPLQSTKAGDTYDPDAFVAKLNASGSALIYSTYLGGQAIEICSDPFCGTAAIAVDSSGNAYVTGTTNSSDFPTANPLQSTLKGFSNAFVAKLNTAGSALVYSSYLGGDNYNYGNGISVNSNGNAYIVGSTESKNFPVFRALQPNCAVNSDNDVTLTKLNAAGTRLVYSTCIGGSGDDYSQGIAVDRYGSAYVAGGTGSANFPTFKALQPVLRGSSDAFVMKISGN